MTICDSYLAREKRSIDVHEVVAHECGREIYLEHSLIFLAAHKFLSQQRREDSVKTLKEESGEHFETKREAVTMGVKVSETPMNALLLRIRSRK